MGSEELPGQASAFSSVCITHTHPYYLSVGSSDGEDTPFFYKQGPWIKQAVGSRNGDCFGPAVSALTELFTCSGHCIPLPGLLPQGDHVGLLCLCSPKNISERLGKRWPWHSCGGPVAVGVCKQWDDPLTTHPRSLCRNWHLPQLHSRTATHFISCVQDIVIHCFASCRDRMTILSPVGTRAVEFKRELPGHAA